jgi:hyperosmotically inducible periplasmic protein
MKMVFSRTLRTCVWIAALCAATLLPVATTRGQDKEPGLNSPVNRDQRRIVSLAEEVRHQLVTLPYYSVFDWLEAGVNGNGEVTLTGDVVRPTTKSDAEVRIKNLESVTNVINKINVLPLSRSDDDLRVAMYRAIFSFGSPLFRYATAAVPSIHITVANGHVRLRGVVASKEDAQLAYVAASGVPGAFEVQNELKAERDSESQ